ncbi:glutathione transport system permease protein GsiD [Oxobacter pfennigii]|uniref:Glutathione transport system permease protein GsiD n=1 Tax=Oxobacter pfennigii TaxID=36849 RepID=A0A0P8WVZ0_9CLOT|nr:ABC transporter permease [Oxobacter pfennigii]KPU42418.1 glutathione transport system permease protein GsiD [Oxobacter pfennigii]
MAEISKDTQAEKKVKNRSSKKPGLGLWKRLKKNKLAMAGLFIVSIIFIVALFAPLISPYDPDKQDVTIRLLKIGSPGHILGTDEYGRDLLSRVIYGARISLLVGFCSVAFGLIFGVILGLVSGYYSKLDSIIMRIVDILLAFPGVLLALAIVSALGPGIINVIIAIGIWSVPTVARVVRSTVLYIKELDYVTAARALGDTDFNIIFREILPNCISPIIVYATMRLATAILSAATLSFLGLGAQPPMAEWGAMASTGRNFIYQAPHLTLIPGAAIIIVVFGFNSLGDGLRDALDPNLKNNL